MSFENHVVVDLETLGLEPSSIILSIGAISNTGENFYRELNWKEQECTRAVNVDTCLWWGQQEKDLCPLKGSVLLQDALVEFSRWLPKDSYVWCRGLDMDGAILKDAYRLHHLSPPWKYNKVRDVRTALHKVPKENLVTPVRKHHALDDAVADMKNLVNAGWVTLKEGEYEPRT